jgi:hypothetical protein
MSHFPYRPDEFPPIPEGPITGLAAVRSLCWFITIVFTLAALNMEALLRWWNS